MIKNENSGKIVSIFGNYDIGEREKNRVYKGVYIDTSVCRALENRKEETGASFSFQVNKALRLYLGFEKAKEKN